VSVSAKKVRVNQCLCQSASKKSSESLVFSFGAEGGSICAFFVLNLVRHPLGGLKGSVNPGLNLLIRQIQFVVIFFRAISAIRVQFFFVSFCAFLWLFSFIRRDLQDNPVILS
jgi:hypothetical protein